MFPIHRERDGRFVGVVDSSPISFVGIRADHDQPELFDGA